MLLAPAFLLGLLAIGMPLWLHRVARANPTRHQFASLMLLQASETQRTAQRRLRYWLLLSTRILLLLALIAAFAGPLLPARLLPQAGSQVRLHAIVLDASLSMQYDTRWSRALQAAEAVLDGLHSPDRVMLVTATGRRINVVHGATPAADAGAIRASLRQLKPGVERLDYGAAMSTAGNWLGSPRPAVVLHLICDAQRSAAPLRFADLEPPDDAQLVVHDVATGAADNVFVESATLVGAADKHDLQVMIRSTASRPLRREASLSIDGQRVAQRGIEVPGAPVRAAMPGGEGEGAGGPASDISPIGPPDLPAGAVFAFTGLTLTPGAHRIEVAIEPADGLPLDDHFRAVVQHASPRVLLISNTAEADDAAYFAAAIGSLSSPRLAVEQRTVNAVGSEMLAGYSLVVVADAAALSKAVATRLEQYVAGGGAVLATLGTGSVTSTPLLQGWRIGEARARASKVGEIAATHPVLREADDWHHVRFFRQRSVSPASGDKVLMAHEDGEPLLVEHHTGAGRMLVLTQPIAREWNDVAIHPLFVRFVAEAARYLAGGAAEAASTTVGASVLTGLPASGGGQIFDPQGARVLALAQSAAADRLVPEQTGFYEIRGNDGARWIAVNTDTRESDLTALPAAFMQRWQAMRVRKAPGAAVAAREQVSPRSLGPLLMWLAAALILAELLLANGHLAIRREVPR